MRWLSVCVLCVVWRLAVAKAKADVHAYATPTPVRTPAAEFDRLGKQVPLQDTIVAANITDTDPIAEAQAIADAAAESDTDDEDDAQQDIQALLRKDPLVQIARHMSHGLLDPTREPPYSCQSSYSVEIISRDPLILYIRDFLQPLEAEHMITQSVPLMARSMVAAQGDGETSAMKNKKDQHRTSSSAFMSRGQDAVMTCIEQRAADIVGEDRTHVEGLQVVWYTKNQKYNPHFDYFPEDSDYYQAYTANGGQRTYTFFVYLTDATYDPESGERIELEGGHTSFPKLGISFPPEKGSAVFWTNMNIDGSEDERVLHGGDPVIRGQKMAVNIWFREKEFN